MLGIGFWISFSTAVLWEIIENLSCVIQVCREIDDPNYLGDSYINIISDCVVFIAGYIFVAWAPWYGAPTYFIVTEIFQLWYMRNNFTLMCFAVVSKGLGCPPQRLFEWQTGAFDGKVWYNGELFEPNSEALLAKRAAERSAKVE